MMMKGNFSSEVLNSLASLSLKLIIAKLGFDEGSGVRSIIDSIDLGTYSNYFSPLLFSYFILRLKLDSNVFVVLILSFLLGMGVDIFRDTLGLNAAALVAVAFLRKYFLSIISEREDFDSMMELDFFNLGVVRYLIYFGLGILTHHFIFVLLEQFSFHSFFFSVLFL